MILLAGGEGLLDEHLLDAGCGVGLVDGHARFEVVGEQLHEDWYVLVLNLVSEHVHEFDAGCFQNWQVVDVLARSALELRDDQLLQVVPKQGLVDEQLRGAVGVGVD